MNSAFLVFDLAGRNAGSEREWNANNFRTVADIRFKLLGFLPGGTEVIPAV